jgi:tetratricopeptide (TPR) repeat protein
MAATGDPDEAPRAWRNIGTLKEDLFGDVEGAKGAYETAIAFEHPLNSEGARVNLAQLLERQGDVTGAAVRFREAIASGHPVESGRARTLLGWLLEAQGDEQGALALFIDGMAEEPTGEWGQRAAFGAGTIFRNRGELDRALDAFSVAERIEDPAAAGPATYMLAGVAKQLGQEQVALDAFSRLARTGGVADAVATEAAKEAGLILFERREGAAARDFFALAARAEEGEARARGCLLLALCERQLGNRPAAAAAAEQAIATPGAPPEVVDHGTRLLAELR